MTITAEIVAYGTVEHLAEGTWAAARAEMNKAGLKGDDRKTFMKATRTRVASEHAHLFEVYGLLFGDNTEKVVAFNRAYKAVCRLSWDEAVALMEGSAVTSAWSGYTLGDFTGDAIWIMHPESKGGARSEIIKSEEEVINRVKRLSGAFL